MRKTLRGPGAPASRKRWRSASRSAEAAWASSWRRRSRSGVFE
jgi:hypothetical protein